MTKGVIGSNSGGNSATLFCRTAILRLFCHLRLMCPRGVHAPRTFEPPYANGVSVSASGMRKAPSRPSTRKKRWSSSFLSWTCPRCVSHLAEGRHGEAGGRAWQAREKPQGRWRGSGGARREVVQGRLVPGRERPRVVLQQQQPASRDACRLPQRDDGGVGTRRLRGVSPAELGRASRKSEHTWCLRRHASGEDGARGRSATAKDRARGPSATL